TGGLAPEDTRICCRHEPSSAVRSVPASAHANTPRESLWGMAEAAQVGAVDRRCDAGGGGGVVEGAGRSMGMTRASHEPAPTATTTANPATARPWWRRLLPRCHPRRDRPERVRECLIRATIARRLRDGPPLPRLIAVRDVRR